MLDEIYARPIRDLRQRESFRSKDDKKGQDVPNGAQSAFMQQHNPERPTPEQIAARLFGGRDDDRQRTR